MGFSWFFKIIDSLSSFIIGLLVFSNLMKKYFKYILLIMLLQLSHFFLPFIPTCPALPSHQHSTLLTSCPWVVHISSLAPPFPILFLASLVYFVPTIYASYSQYIYPLSAPAVNPPCDLHFCDSVPVLAVCLVCCYCCFCFSFCC